MRRYKAQVESHQNLPEVRVLCGASVSIGTHIQVACSTFNFTVDFPICKEIVPGITRNQKRNRARTYFPAVNRNLNGLAPNCDSL